MRKRTRRLILILFAGVLLGGAAALALWGLKGSIVYFYGPAEIAQRAAPGQRVRLGGLVAAGTVRREASGALDFRVTDGRVSVPVRYSGATPDLFREAKGVVAEGKWSASGVFLADTVLAKHDENYMPKEVADEIKARGEWRGR